MKALVWKENGQIELEVNWPNPTSSSEEVMVRVMAAGICMTDIHMITGQLNFASPPWVLGHEMSGVIERVGSDVGGWRPGDRVVIDPVVTCGCCRYCQSGKKYLCPAGGELGTTYSTGGYGEFVVVKPSNLYRLPQAMNFAEGAMMEPLNCTLGAIERVNGMTGSNVLVFGPGPAGLLFVQLAKAYGALSVTLVGTAMDEQRLALGKRLGADVMINIGQSNLADELQDREYDVAIEASGSVQGVSDCFNYVTKSGTVVLYGLHGSNQPTVDSDTIIGKDLTVVTCISAPLLWEKGIKLVEASKVDVRSIISDMVPFEEAGRMVNAIVDRTLQPIKAMISYE